MIYFDDDTIKIDSVVLQGIYKSIEVEHEAKIDEQTVEGSSFKPKQATGYEDAKINIEISLMDSESATKEDKLKAIQELFKPAGHLPQPHELISAHASIRGVEKVIIKKMSSKETNKKDEIVVNIELLQYDTMKIKAASGTSSKKSSNGTGKKENISSLSENYKNYLDTSRGTAPKRLDKTTMTPAQDERWRMQYGGRT